MKLSSSLLAGNGGQKTGKQVIAEIDERKQQGFKKFLSDNIGQSMAGKFAAEYARVDKLAERTAAENRMLRAYDSVRETWLAIEGQVHQMEKNTDDPELSALHERTIQRLTTEFQPQRQELIDAANALKGGAQ